MFDIFITASTILLEKEMFYWQFSVLLNKFYACQEFKLQINFYAFFEIKIKNIYFNFLIFQIFDPYKT